MHVCTIKGNTFTVLWKRKNFKQQNMQQTRGMTIATNKGDDPWNKLAKKTRQMTLTINKVDDSRNKQGKWLTSAVESTNPSSLAAASWRKSFNKRYLLQNFLISISSSANGWKQRVKKHALWRDFDNIGMGYIAVIIEYFL